MAPMKWMEFGGGAAIYQYGGQGQLRNRTGNNSAEFRHNGDILRATTWGQAEPQDKEGTQVRVKLGQGTVDWYGARGGPKNQCLI